MSECTILPKNFVETIVKKFMKLQPEMSEDDVLKSLVEEKTILRANFHADACTDCDEYKCRSLDEEACDVCVEDDDDGNEINEKVVRYIKYNINFECYTGKYPHIDFNDNCSLYLDKFDISDGFNCGFADLDGHVFYIKND